MKNNILYNFKKKFINNVGPLGLLKLTKTISSRAPKILMYHRFSKDYEPNKISESTFVKQLELLVKNHNVISMQDMVKSIINDKELPKNSVVITIDDGYIDFYKIAFPILREYKLPATIYITTGFINKDIWLWPDIFAYIINSTKVTSFRIKIKNTEVSVNLDSNKNKKRAWGMFINECLKMNEVEKYNTIEEVKEISGVELPDKQLAEYSAMNWDQVIEISNNGIEVGAHTINHPRLSNLSVDEAEKEIINCKNIIESKIKKNVQSFCYPNGTIEDYSEDIKHIVKKAGYRSAVAAFYDKSDIDDLFEIRRYAAGENMYHFMKVINGIEYISNRYFNR